MSISINFNPTNKKDYKQSINSRPRVNVSIVFYRFWFLNKCPNAANLEISWVCYLYRDFQCKACLSQIRARRIKAVLYQHQLASANVSVCLELNGVQLNITITIQKYTITVIKHNFTFLNDICQFWKKNDGATKAHSSINKSKLKKIGEKKGVYFFV